ncbi:HD-like signal output (HDOD) protein [Povalibacter uvarum]|uniref:HD-like signal output (HDOD) protein n=1 Tax=Povalibacter uvarum TaxID=732238 RepID=A0A841HMC9_9GAMM|nr:HDOD domain-containing protein [Povalibacter uvarum]MBB6094257.1 HD-like signal output (HDOD) protein [Povalibacter uvarum]
MTTNNLATAAADEVTQPSGSSGAFQFVAELAEEVSKGKVELPSFPDVAVRVRKVLADEGVSTEQIARVVGSDAGLAARVLTLANSVALNRSGKTIAEIKTAVNRIGHNNVRTAAVSFAIAQLRRAAELRHIAKELEGLWQEATMVAAHAYAIASRATKINADECMLAGLLHNVGKIYILARANRHGSLFRDPATLAHVIRDWHSNVGKAIIENWGFPEHISDAVADHENIDRTAGHPDVTDVLTVAVMMSGFVGHEADLELNMQGVKAFWRLGLDNEKCVHIVNDCKDEIAALRTALGD